MEYVNKNITIVKDEGFANFIGLVIEDNSKKAIFPQSVEMGTYTRKDGNEVPCVKLAYSNNSVFNITAHKMWKVRD